MALTQIQTIQSLGNHLQMLEQELGFGVPATELRHLVGRIGELYAAVLTNGQMASRTNQRGYDVVSAAGERISVKTSASLNGGPIYFNKNTLDQVDRIVIIRINTEEMAVETVLDCAVADAPFGKEYQGKLPIEYGKLLRNRTPKEHGDLVNEVRYGERIIREFENGSVTVEEYGQPLVARQVLREIAKALGISILNSQGNTLNTRQLGYRIIAELASS